VYLGLISWRRLFACDSCEADATVLAYRATFTGAGSDFVYRVFLLGQLHDQCRQPSGGSRAGDDQPHACQTEWAHRITSRSDGEA